MEVYHDRNLPEDQRTPSLKPDHSTIAILIVAAIAIMIGTAVIFRIKGFI